MLRYAKSGALPQQALEDLISRARCATRYYPGRARGDDVIVGR
ncbi:MAG: hypothetical protein ACRDTA_13440 [Pseudonocardiaceae bacterium]